MKIVFSGDRKSKGVRFGYFLKKIFPKNIVISGWDGYKTHIFRQTKERINR